MGLDPLQTVIPWTLGEENPSNAAMEMIVYLVFRFLFEGKEL